MLKAVKMWNATGGRRCDIGYGLGEQWGGWAVGPTTAAYRIGHRSPSNLPDWTEPDPYCPWSLCFIEIGPYSDWSRPGHVEVGGLEAHLREEDDVAIHASTRLRGSDSDCGSYSMSACIGLPEEGAKWCYDNLPNGTWVLEWSHSASTSYENMNPHGHFSNEYGTRDMGSIYNTPSWLDDQAYIDFARHIVERANLPLDESPYIFLYDFDLCRCIVFASEDAPEPSGDWDDVKRILLDRSDPTGRGVEMTSHDHIKWIAAVLKDCSAKCDKLLKEV